MPVVHIMLQYTRAFDFRDSFYQAVYNYCAGG